MGWESGRKDCKYMLYFRPMTEEEVIAHWRKGSQSELQSATLLSIGGQYSGALFHCHLAVEKGLKALYMEQHRKDAPLTHDLLQIALQIERLWTVDEKKLFADLTEYAVAARYDDPFWAEREATADNVNQWLRRIASLLSTFFHAA